METPTPIKAPVYTHGKYWGGTVAPYWLFLLFTAFPLTGFLGIDHLLFRSPSTAIFKLIMNVLGLGIWYFYDMIQAFSDRDFVKEYGFSGPIVGPLGLAMDYFRNITGKDKNGGPESASGLTSIFFFVVYFFTIMVPFGVGNIVAGDTEGGIWRFVLSAMTFLFVILFIPYFFFVSLYELYRLIFQTQSVLDEGLIRAPPITMFAQPKGIAYYIASPSVIAKAKEEDAKTGGFYNKYIKPLGAFLPIKEAEKAFDTTKCAVAPPIKATAAAAVTAGEGVVELAATAPAIVAESTNKMASFTDPAKLAAAAAAVPATAVMAQKGGALLGIDAGWDGIILGGIVLLIVGGFTVTALRNYAASLQKKKDDKPERVYGHKFGYDAPPNPRHV